MQTLLFNLHNISVKISLKHIILCLLLFTGNSFSIYAQIDKTSSILSSLDQALDQQDYYVKLKEVRIDSLKKQLETPKISFSKQYLLLNRISKEYKAYISDSSLLYAMKSCEVAEKLRNKEWVDEANIYTSFALITRGMYKEAIEVQQKIDRKTLPDSLLTLWFHSQQQLYHSLALYTYHSPYAQSYTQLDHSYGDSLQASYPTNSITSRYNKIKRVIVDKEYAKGVDMLETLIKEVPENSVLRGAMYFTLADAYRKLKEMNKFEEYLAYSAIADIHSVTKENAALYTLAIHLYKNGDVKRAYKYIMVSLEDAVLCNAKLRTTRISRILPVISDAYKLQESQRRKIVFTFMIATSILSFCLAIAIFMTYKQMKKYSVAKEKLNQTNIIKEEYIRHFLYLCSAYIGKLDSFRRLVNRKITVGQTDELLKMTKSTDMAELEQKEFYSNFDQAFLHLYPDFVSDFNKLLLPKERIILKPDELLNNELRIFALVRLGITDSSKIASFLHYSINTIYTYRNKIKNKAINREEFESQIPNIGKS